MVPVSRVFFPFLDQSLCITLDRATRPSPLPPTPQKPPKFIVDRYSCHGRTSDPQSFETNPATPSPRSRAAKADRPRSHFYPERTGRVPHHELRSPPEGDACSRTWSSTTAARRLDELIHHTAEAAVLRDLFAGATVRS